MCAKALLDGEGRWNFEALDTFDVKVLTVNHCGVIISSIQKSLQGLDDCDLEKQTKFCKFISELLEKNEEKRVEFEEAVNAMETGSSWKECLKKIFQEKPKTQSSKSPETNVLDAMVENFIQTGKNRDGLITLFNQY